MAVHVAVTALANFRITNEASIRALFGFRTRDAARLDSDLDQYADMILGWLGGTPTNEAASLGHSAPPEPAIPPGGLS